ncbi:hypothetical protein BS50DRAFT_386365 [Corynespora cassiicola Philippines]|uniref:Uncharacterized protein n=1 Tax=Corynespora cassiicola Philippines TaxID=1448308 RepID=A0A2T2NP72_CORCC|nr:hypothetical protein BS50DRAFT_386365 [Corynespora cassiicola Philippines]
MLPHAPLPSVSRIIPRPDRVVARAQAGQQEISCAHRALFLTATAQAALAPSRLRPRYRRNGTRFTFSMAVCSSPCGCADAPTRHVSGREPGPADGSRALSNGQHTGYGIAPVLCAPASRGTRPFQARRPVATADRRPSSSSLPKAFSVGYPDTCMACKRSRNLKSPPAVPAALLAQTLASPYQSYQPHQPYQASTDLHRPAPSTVRHLHLLPALLLLPAVVRIESTWVGAAGSVDLTSDLP